MKAFDKNKAGNMLALLIGILYIVAIVYEYYPAIKMKEYIHFGEWCFVSGVVGGLFYTLTFFYQQIKGKILNQILFLNITSILEVIFIATIAIQLNLGGALWYLHVIGPIMVFVHFLWFCDCRKIAKPIYVLTSIIFPSCYIFVIAIVYRICGYAPFPVNIIFEQNNIGIKLGMIAGLSLLILLITFFFYAVNVLLHKKIWGGKYEQKSS